jgi:hypothetical protein
MDTPNPHSEPYSRGPFPASFGDLAYLQHLSQNPLNLSHYRKKMSPKDSAKFFPL